jgi:hypothetical protein
VGTYNTNHEDYLHQFIGKRITDCYGLVKSFVWWNDGDVRYVAAQDRNEQGAYNAAEAKGPLATIPDIPGVVLWMKGHAGVYIGGGEFIECIGAPTGMRKGKIQNGAVVSGSKFTHWFEDTYITYSGVPAAPAVPDNPTLRRGDKNDAVKAMQERLNDAGYAIAVDGDFGPATEDAVKKFQQSKDLSVDGICGPVTWGALPALHTPPPVPEKTPEALTVDNALAAGIITEKQYWLNVLTGQTAADAAFIKIMMDNAIREIEAKGE